MRKNSIFINLQLFYWVLNYANFHFFETWFSSLDPVFGWNQLIFRISCLVANLRRSLELTI